MDPLTKIVKVYFGGWGGGNSTLKGEIYQVEF